MADRHPFRLSRTEKGLFDIGSIETAIWRTL